MMRDDPLQCTNPPPLSDDALAGLLDGIPDDNAQVHLAACPSCAARLQALRKWDGALTARLARFDCPPAQQLADFHAGWLSADDARSLEAHIADCPRCQDELTMLNAFIDEPQLHIVPKPVVPAILRPAKEYWQASLIEQRPASAMRGFDQLHFDARARSATIYLEAQRHEPGVVLSGQVVDSEVSWTGALAELWQAGSLKGFRVLDDLCEFTFRLPSIAPVSLYITGLGGIAVALEHLALSDLNP